MKTKTMMHGSILLAEYLSKKAMSGVELVKRVNAAAEDLGVAAKIDSGQLSRMLTGNRLPRIPILSVLDVVTNHRVPLLSWAVMRPVPPKKRMAARQKQPQKQ